VEKNILSMDSDCLNTVSEMTYDLNIHFRWMFIYKLTNTGYMVLITADYTTRRGFP